MRLPLIFALAFVVAIGFVFAGRYFVRNPEKVYKAVSFGHAAEPGRLGALRVIGWSYIVGGAIAALLFGAATILILIHSH
jgi:hypothetical protein